MKISKNFRKKGALNNDIGIENIAFVISKDTIIINIAI